MMSDRRGGLSHPVLYSHPETGRRTMCFHLGMTEGFVIDKGERQANFSITLFEFQQNMNICQVYL